MLLSALTQMRGIEEQVLPKISIIKENQLKFNSLFDTLHQT